MNINNLKEMREKILFDFTACQPSIEAKFHGGSEYAKYILREAVKHGNLNFDVVYYQNLQIDKEILNLLNEKGIQQIPVKSKNDIKKIILNGNYKSFYSAHPYNYTDFEFESTKFIMTIHGLRLLELPYDFTQIYYPNYSNEKLKLLIKNIFFPGRDYSKFKQLISIKNKHIITVSEHSRYALLNFYPELTNKEISVFYSPFEFTKTRRLNDSPNDYYLLVSTNRWIKNNYRAIKAFDKLFSQGKLQGKQVVALGANDITFESKLNNPSKFNFVDYVSQEKLNNYFSNAYCFVYPSLNEGFGYPPLQAMVNEIPVLASAATSIPEVCGNAALYFLPKSIDEIANRILQIDQNLNLKEQLISNGIKRIQELKLLQERNKQKLIELIFGSRQ